jgi:predicted glycosyltransferase
MPIVATPTAAHFGDRIWITGKQEGTEFLLVCRQNRELTGLVNTSASLGIKAIACCADETGR